MGFEQNGEKLIRHRIPDNVPKHVKRAMELRVVEGDEHIAFLKWKLAEEAGEVMNADAKTFVEELADVRQVVSDFCTVAGIKFSSLRVPVPEDGPPEQSEKIRFFRSQIERLLELAKAVPDDDIDRTERMGDVLQVITTIAHVAGIRDQVRTAMTKKLQERGDFVHGIVLKMPPKKG
jgi:predicted house-cleaning noncanonical NTP pyrophosphatase (MazG superfamily)